jgi:hypothetical protein
VAASARTLPRVWIRPGRRDLGRDRGNRGPRHRPQGHARGPGDRRYRPSRCVRARAGRVDHHRLAAFPDRAGRDGQCLRSAWRLRSSLHSRCGFGPHSSRPRSGCRPHADPPSHRSCGNRSGGHRSGASRQIGGGYRFDRNSRLDGIPRLGGTPRFDLSRQFDTSARSDTILRFDRSPRFDRNLRIGGNLRDRPSRNAYRALCRRPQSAVPLNRRVRGWAGTTRHQVSGSCGAPRRGPAAAMSFWDLRRSRERCPGRVGPAPRCRPGARLDRRLPSVPRHRCGRSVNPGRRWSRAVADLSPTMRLRRLSRRTRQRRRCVPCL